MSGSYDRPGGRPPYQQGAPGYDPYDEIPTGSPGSAGGPREQFPLSHGRPAGGPYPGQHPGGGLQLPNPNTAAPGPLPGQSRDAYTPGKADAEPVDKHAPIVPAGSVTGRSLTLVISIMCFLACLTAGAVYMMHQSAEAWMRDIASEVTVQLEPKQGTDTEKQLKEVVAFLQGQPGIRFARALGANDSAELLQPWLGASDVLKTLPVPRLVALELDTATPPDLDALRANLTKQFKGVSLDDHRQWQRQIRTVTRSFALGGLAILLLVGAATTAIIVSATRSAMASNREIVEVLHFIGATDRFIAHEFEKHFLRLGIKAGLVGALLAMTVFITMPTILELLGGGSVTLAEMHRMIGSGALDPSGYVLLGILVVVVAALCMITSRLGVYRILNSKT